MQKKIEDCLHLYLGCEAWKEGEPIYALQQVPSISYLAESKVSHYLKPLVPPDTAQSAADTWVFETNGHRWSNNNNEAGDNHESFLAGVSWQMAQGWIDAETKPESGKRVLIHWKNSVGLDRISIGYYAAKHSVEYSDDDTMEYADYCEEDDKYYEPEGWVENGWELEYSATLTGVIRWQPLPKL